MRHSCCLLITIINKQVMSTIKKQVMSIMTSKSQVYTKDQRCLSCSSISRFVVDGVCLSKKVVVGVGLTLLFGALKTKRWAVGAGGWGRHALPRARGVERVGASIVCATGRRRVRFRGWCAVHRWSNEEQCKIRQMKCRHRV